MPARPTGWYPLTMSARLYSGPPRDYAVGGLGEYNLWQEPQIDTQYFGPIRRWPMGKSIFASKVAPYAWSSPYADPTGVLEHVGERGVGPVPGSPSMSGIAEDLGGAAGRIVGLGLGWWVGRRFGMIEGLLGAGLGYVAGAALTGDD